MTATPEELEAKEQELAAREAELEERAKERGGEEVDSRVDKLSADDPLAGTVDDPNVEDPYAHLRDVAKEQGTEKEAEE